MARIVVSSAGTTGDFVPFVALGKLLKARGHDVLMAINAAMIPLAERAGLSAVACGRTFGADEARERAETFAEGEATSGEDAGNALRQLRLGDVYRDLLEAAKGADLLVSSSLQGVAPWVHEATGVPWVNATIFAMEFPHGESPPPPASDAEKAQWRALFDYRNEVREAVGLPAIADEGWKEYYWSKRLVLVASSEHFSVPRLVERPQARMTGFWFEDSSDPKWEPDSALLAFLASGPAPLVLTLSSLPVTDPARVVNLHAEAAAALGMRVVIQQGWAGLSVENLSESLKIDTTAIHFTGHVPHSWLFPQCAAVIHHGGIGTTAQGLRCGCPMLVEPYCNDQFFNAGRVAALGVGVAVDHRRLTPANLAAALAEHVLTEDAIRKAEAIGQKIREEDGLTRACTLIENQLEGLREA